MQEEYVNTPTPPLDYTVVFSSSVEELEKEVRELIDEGWIPQGGIYGNASGHCQAMVIYDEFEEEVGEEPS